MSCFSFYKFLTGNQIFTGKKLVISSATTKFVLWLNICITGRYLSFHAQHGCPQCPTHGIPTRKLHSFHFWKNKCWLGLAKRLHHKVNIDDGFLNLMNTEGASKDDVKVPEGDIGTQIQAGFDDGKDLLVTIVSAMGEEQVSFAIPTFGLDVHL